jgi:hypothetical protein
MFKEILQEIAEGRGTSRAALARRLELSEDALAQMLNHLVRKGYLAPLTSEASSPCHGCGIRQACSACPDGSPPPSQGWILTDKGQRLAQG